LRIGRLIAAGAALMFATALAAHAQQVMHARVDITREGRQLKDASQAVIWLMPVGAQVERVLQDPAHIPALVQRDKKFHPSLLVIPVGGKVQFPNDDPFFHNVFSLFDGKRFDLGLYEAGSTRSVVFSRVGVSYIFCNIHSEMSAVVIALDTPFYSVADPHGTFRMQDIPDGDYSLHVWVEAQPQNALDQQTRQVHIAGTVADLGDIRADRPEEQHLNKFGRPYEPDAEPPY